MTIPEFDIIIIFNYPILDTILVLTGTTFPGVIKVLVCAGIIIVHVKFVQNLPNNLC